MTAKQSLRSLCTRECVRDSQRNPAGEWARKIKFVLAARVASITPIYILLLLLLYTVHASLNIYVWSLIFFFIDGLRPYRESQNYIIYTYIYLERGKIKRSEIFKQIDGKGNFKKKKNNKEMILCLECWKITDTQTHILFLLVVFKAEKDVK